MKTPQNKGVSLRDVYPGFRASFSKRHRALLRWFHMEFLPWCEGNSIPEDERQDLFDRVMEERR